MGLSVAIVSAPALAEPLLLDALLPPPVSHPPASHPTVEAPTITVFRAWQRQCPADGAERATDCVLAYAGLPDRPETAIGPDSPILSLSIVPSGPGSAPLLIVRSRFGLLLTEGMTLTIDGTAPRRLAFRSCHATARVLGCILPARVSGAFARALKGGLTMTLGARTTDGRTLSQTISLMGITAGLTAVTHPEPTDPGT